VNRRLALRRASAFAVPAVACAACVPVTAGDTGADRVTLPQSSTRTTPVGDPKPVMRATPAPPPASSGAWEREWDDLVVAATQEGKLSLLTGVSRGYRAAVERFAQLFPDIAVEHVPEAFADTWLRRAREGRRSGAVTLDVALGIQPDRALVDGAAEALWAPLKPLLFRPDVVDVAAWLGGPDSRFLDVGGTHCFGWSLNVFHPYAVNTDLVPQTAIRSVPDLLDPRWRGRIVAPDPRLGGGTLLAASVLRSWGPDVLRRLLVDQRPVFVNGGPEQVTEPLAYGRFPIAVGVRPKALDPLRARGIGLQVRYLDLPDADFAVSSPLLSFAGAPHPAAASLFANWVLTQEAQALLSASLPTNSARADVSPGIPDEIAPAPAVYFESDREANFVHTAETQRLVRTLLARG
jgi:iron(III) transport system substrate-binding protein